MLKTQLDMALLLVTLLELDGLRGPCHPQPLCGRKGSEGQTQEIKSADLCGEVGVSPKHGK